MASGWRPGDLLPVPGPYDDAQRVHAQRAQEYRHLVGRARRLVEARTPPGATVLVASKGDPDLVSFSARAGGHFLQERTGTYAGRHPASGAEAIAQLEDLAAGPAGYLLLPATASWWWDSYPEFIDHLEEHHAVVATEDETGALYALAPTGGSRERPQRQDRRTACDHALDILLHHVVPDGAAVVVPSSGGPTERQVLSWVLDAENGQGVSMTEAVDALEGLSAGGARYLVIPASEHDPVAAVPGLTEHLLVHYRVVLEQPHLGTVFFLRRGGGDLVGVCQPRRTA